MVDWRNNEMAMDPMDPMDPMDLKSPPPVWVMAFRDL